ncbi:MAG: metalloregulator ArsR/SmtB family transcription factor [Planctomycetota bacterium]|nr:metalloregulator ArsR/SmtB family transcription factor [Planctomycetota bacterium]
MDPSNSSLQQAELCATFLKALGDPVRLQIVNALQYCPLTVSDLVELLDIEMPNVSHHLRVLFHAQLVTMEKEGKFNYYRLNPAFASGRSIAKSLDFGCCKINLRG